MRYGEKASPLLKLERDLPPQMYIAPDDVSLKNVSGLTSLGASRRRFLKISAATTAAAGTALLLSQLPFGSGQQYQEEVLEVPYSTKPLSPSDIQGKGSMYNPSRWTGADMWADSAEVQFYPRSSPDRQGYLRYKWGKKDSFEGLALLVDAVTETVEPPATLAAIAFDTYNNRLNVPEPANTPGFYAAAIGFNPPGQLHDLFVGFSGAPGLQFPVGTLYYNWARAPSPIANNDEIRLKPHVLICILLSKKLLTTKYEEIGARFLLKQTKDDFISMGFPERGYANMSFPEVSIPELPNYAIVRDMFAALGMAAVAPYAFKLLKR